MLPLESHEVHESRQSSIALAVSVTTPVNKQQLRLERRLYLEGARGCAKRLIVMRLFEVTGVWQLIRIYAVLIAAPARAVPPR